MNLLNPEARESALRTLLQGLLTTALLVIPACVDGVGGAASWQAIGMIALTALAKDALMPAISVIHAALAPRATGGKTEVIGVPVNAPLLPEPGDDSPQTPVDLGGVR